MKRILLCLLLALAVSNLAAVDLVPKAAQDRGKSAVLVSRSLTRPMSSLGADSSYAANHRCKIKLTDPYFGYKSDDEYFGYFTASIFFRCVSARYERIHDGAPVRYDEASNQWVRDITKIEGYPSNEMFDEYPKIAKNSAELIDKTTHFYPLKNVNSTGYAYTFDGVVGKEFARTLRYCLIHDVQALCGEYVVGNANTKKNSGMTPYVLSVLRSIEFIEDESPPTSVDAQASPQ